MKELPLHPTMSLLLKRSSDGWNLEIVIIEDREAVKHAATITFTQNHVASTNRDKLVLINSPKTSSHAYTKNRLSNKKTKNSYLNAQNLKALGGLEVKCSPESFL